MDSKLNIAKDCFVEDVEMFANPETDAEKFNLYNGFALIPEPAHGWFKRLARDSGGKADRYRFKAPTSVAPEGG